MTTWLSPAALGSGSRPVTVGALGVRVEQPTDEQAAEWKRMIRETIAKLLPGARTGPDPWLGYLLGRSPLTAVSLGAAAFQPSGEVGTRAPVALV